MKTEIKNSVDSGSIPNGQVEVRVGLEIAVDVPVPEPDVQLLRVVGLDAVRRGQHVPRVNQRAAAHVLRVPGQRGEDGGVPGVLPVPDNKYVCT